MPANIPLIVRISIACTRWSNKTLVHHCLPSRSGLPEWLERTLCVSALAFALVNTSRDLRPLCACLVHASCRLGIGRDGGASLRSVKAVLDAH
ncbi:hypothetical protein CROQUDRAFT_95035 [Cronartium quercuum f. sp. fusiforme G11]|uniref:Uncharacterized protein n=1 Tax=Cronartium quercuum f. sp. fusiforme G11 TaxID=708437 RepID=A0A9P6T9T5_9BASI|nr:hypothetical protein CROQUDRAFT_95035 [Cronartium quercuum f. sp. fusiforme G11]